MYYTSKSTRLATKLLTYLEWIEKTKLRAIEKRELLVEYNTSKYWFSPIRLMTTRHYIESQIERWDKLAEWLVYRYNAVLMELNQENDKQLCKLLLTDKTPV